MNIPELVPEFVWRAWCGGLIIALLAGPLGACVVWKRMAYFGDSLAHASLLGVTLSVVMSWSPGLCILLFALLFSLALFGIEQKTVLAADTLLGIFSHTSLAIGLIAISLLDRYRSDLLGLLFGDVLALSWHDVQMMLGVCLAIFALFAKIWRPMLAIVIDPELAQVEGIRVKRLEAIYVCLLAAFIAVAIKLVGVLLMTALLVIPAAASRQWSRSPFEMAYTASIVGAIAVTGGLTLSLHWDVPAGPSIVVIAASIFFLSIVTKRIS